MRCIQIRVQQEVISASFELEGWILCNTTMNDDDFVAFCFAIIFILIGGVRPLRASFYIITIQLFPLYH
jgi:hypothetical protein